MNDELRREVERWLRFAEEDLQEAERLTEQPGTVPRHPAWLAQQAAEKALKAVLVFEQIAFPYTHNLTTLSNLIPDEWSVAQAEADLERLSEYAVESRYPGDLPEITSTEAEEATADARRLFDATERDVNTRLSDDSSPDE